MKTALEIAKEWLDGCPETSVRRHSKIAKLAEAVVKQNELLEQYKECVLQMDEKMDGLVVAIKEAEECLREYSEMDGTTVRHSKWLKKYGTTSS